MFGINLQNQRGAILLSTLFFVMFLGTLGLVIATLITAENKSQLIYIEERRAFYAAQSGLEYGIRRFLISDVENISSWEEELECGNGLTCKVEAEPINNETVKIISTGQSQRMIKKLEIEIEYIDVASYAVYAAGKVEQVITKTWPDIFGPHNPQLIYQNATIMPIFDLDELRNLSKPSGYYPNNCNVNKPFYFPPNHMVFVEKQLQFLHWSWFGWAHFTVMGNVIMKSPWLPFSAIFGTVYQPSDGAQFIAQKSFLGRSFIGGIITAGDVYGTDKFQWPFLGRLHVFHHRSTIENFMKYSLNGGPLLIKEAVWKNLN